MASPDESGEDSSRPRGLSSGRRDSGGNGHGPVPVTRLSVPIILVVSLVVAAITASGTWFKVQAHADSRSIHLDEHEVIQGGGVAFKNDVSRLQWDFEQRLRRMLAGIKVVCRNTRGSMDSVCSLTLPESGE